MSRFFNNSNISGGTGVQLDDEKISTSTTFSSFRIDQIIQEVKKTSFSGKYEDLIDKPPLGSIDNLDSNLKTLLQGDNKDLNFLNAINKVFQCGNNVKQNAVTALIAKGSTEVTANSSWLEIINAISNLVIAGTPGAPGTLQQVTKLNIAASTSSPITKTIVLDKPLDKTLKLATSMLLFVPGDIGVVEHICGFNNSEGSNFNYNSQFIGFDGKMHPINQVSLPWKSLGSLEGYEYSESEVDEKPYKSLDGLVDNTTNLVLGIVPPDQLITAKSDINLRGVQTLKSITENSQGFRFALSFDSGVTYYVWNSTTWVTVDINNLEDVKSKFMTKATLDSLNSTQLETLRDKRSSLRIAYLAEQTLSTDSCYTDQLDITVDMEGKDIIAPQANWGYSILEDMKTLQYTFYANGTYTINYTEGGA